MFVRSWVSTAASVEVLCGSFSKARQHEESLFSPPFPLHNEMANFEEV